MISIYNMTARWAQNILPKMFDEKCFDEVNIRQNVTSTKKHFRRNGSVDEVSFDEVTYIHFPSPFLSSSVYQVYKML